MEIILYTHVDNTQKDKLIKKISRFTNLTPVMVFDFKSLLNIIKRRISAQIIIIFLISSHEELDDLIVNKSCLFNTRSIIILPDNREMLSSKALSLHPKYIAHDNHDFCDVCAVLNKMNLNTPSPKGLPGKGKPD